MPDDTQDAKAQKLASARKKVKKNENFRDVDKSAWLLIDFDNCFS